MKLTLTCLSFCFITYAQAQTDTEKITNYIVQEGVLTREVWDKIKND